MNLTATLAKATQDLAWLNTVPHTIDHVVGIWIEASSQQTRPMRHGLSNAELTAEIKASSTRLGGGTSGHSDPTPAAALRGQPDTYEHDETLAQLDAALALVVAATAQLGDQIDDAIGVDRWNPSPGRGRTGSVAVAASRIHRATPSLPLYLPGLDPGGLADVDHLVRDQIAEPSTWLRTKVEGWWCDHHGERLPVAEQKKITPCTTCSPWRTGTIAGSGGQCQQCRTFRGNHGCDPTEPIIRRWEYGKGATPAQVLEAKAGSSKPKRRTA